MSFMGAAATVVARIFRLKSSSGAVLAELNQLLTTTNTPGLELRHNDSAVEDSALAWSTGTTPTVHYVKLYGPKSTGAVDPSTASVTLDTVEATGIANASLSSTNTGADFCSVFAERTPTNADNVAGMQAVGGSTASVAQLLVAASQLDQTITATVGDLFGTTSGLLVTASTGTVDLKPSTQLAINGRKAMVEVLSRYVASNATINPVLVAGTDVAGTSFTVFMKAGDVADCNAVFDFTKTVVGSGVAIGELYINGAARTGQAISNPSAAGGRQCVSQQWQFVAPTDGNRTFKLRASQSVAGATFSCSSIHTTLTVKIKAAL